MNNRIILIQSRTLWTLHKIHNIQSPIHNVTWNVTRVSERRFAAIFLQKKNYHEIVKNLYAIEE